MYILLFSRRGRTIQETVNLIHLELYSLCRSNRKVYTKIITEHCSWYMITLIGLRNMCTTLYSDTSLYGIPLF